MTAVADIPQRGYPSAGSSWLLTEYPSSSSPSAKTELDRRWHRHRFSIFEIPTLYTREETRRTFGKKQHATPSSCIFSGIPMLSSRSRYLFRQDLRAKWPHCLLRHMQSRIGENGKKSRTSVAKDSVNRQKNERSVRRL